MLKGPRLELPKLLWLSGACFQIIIIVVSGIMKRLTDFIHRNKTTYFFAMRAVFRVKSDNRFCLMLNRLSRSGILDLADTGLTQCPLLGVKRTSRQAWD